IFLHQETYFFKSDSISGTIISNLISTCGAIQVISDSVYQFTAHVVTIDSLGIAVSPLTPSRADNYYSYEVYTYPESPYFLLYNSNDFSIDTVNKIIQAHSSGEKEICVVAWNSLYADTVCKTIEVYLGINKKMFYGEFNIHPNPFSHQTIISYSLDNTSQVQLRVFDVLGRTLLQTTPEIQSVGKHEMIFSDENAKGVLLVELTIDGNRV